MVIKQKILKIVLAFTFRQILIRKHSHVIVDAHIFYTFTHKTLLPKLAYLHATY